MDSDLILKSLSEFELSPYEAKSYYSLLGKNSLSAVEIAKISGVPRGRIYEILATLTQKGFCTSISGKVKKYKAADPTILGERIKLKIKRAEEEVSRKKLELENLKKNSQKTIDTLVPLYEKSRNDDSPLEFIEVVKGPFQINQTFMRLLNESKKEIRGLVKAPYSTSRTGLKEQEEAQKEIVKKSKIIIRTIYEIPKSQEEIEWTYGMLDRTASDRDISRVIAEVPMKLGLYDEEIALLPLKDPIPLSDSFTAIVIKHPALVKTLKMTFEMLWEKAEDFRVLKDMKI